MTMEIDEVITETLRKNKKRFQPTGELFLGETSRNIYSYVLDARQHSLSYGVELSTLRKAERELKYHFPYRTEKSIAGNLLSISMEHRDLPTINIHFILVDNFEQVVVLHELARRIFPNLSEHPKKYSILHALISYEWPQCIKIAHEKYQEENITSKIDFFKDFVK